MSVNKSNAVLPIASQKPSFANKNLNSGVINKVNPTAIRSTLGGRSVVLQTDRSKTVKMKSQAVVAPLPINTFSTRKEMTKLQSNEGAAGSSSSSVWGPTSQSGGKDSQDEKSSEISSSQSRRMQSWADMDSDEEISNAREDQQSSSGVIEIVRDDYLESVSSKPYSQDFNDGGNFWTRKAQQISSTNEGQGHTNMRPRSNSAAEGDRELSMDSGNPRYTASQSQYDNNNNNRYSNTNFNNAGYQSQNRGVGYVGRQQQMNTNTGASSSGSVAAGINVNGPNMNMSHTTHKRVYIPYGPGSQAGGSSNYNNYNNNTNNNNNYSHYNQQPPQSQSQSYGSQVARPLPVNTTTSLRPPQPPQSQLQTQQPNPVAQANRIDEPSSWRRERTSNADDTTGTEVSEKFDENRENSEIHAGEFHDNTSASIEQQQQQQEHFASEVGGEQRFRGNEGFDRRRPLYNNNSDEGNRGAGGGGGYQQQHSQNYYNNNNNSFRVGSGGQHQNYNNNNNNQQQQQYRDGNMNQMRSGGYNNNPHLRSGQMQGHNNNNNQWNGGGGNRFYSNQNQAGEGDRDRGDDPRFDDRDRDRDHYQQGLHHHHQQQQQQQAPYSMDQHRGNTTSSSIDDRPIERGSLFVPSLPTVDKDKTSTSNEGSQEEKPSTTHTTEASHQISKTDILRNNNHRPVSRLNVVSQDTTGPANANNDQIQSTAAPVDNSNKKPYVSLFRKDIIGGWNEDLNLNAILDAEIEDINSLRLAPQAAPVVPVSTVKKLYDPNTKSFVTAETETNADKSKAGGITEQSKLNRKPKAQQSDNSSGAEVINTKGSPRANSKSQVSDETQWKRKIISKAPAELEVNNTEDNKADGIVPIAHVKTPTVLLQRPHQAPKVVDETVTNIAQSNTEKDVTKHVTSRQFTNTSSTIKTYLRHEPPVETDEMKEKRLARAEERVRRGPRTNGLLFKYNENGDIEQVLSEAEKITIAAREAEMLVYEQQKKVEAEVAVANRRAGAGGGGDKSSKDFYDRPRQSSSSSSSYTAGAGGRSRYNTSSSSQDSHFNSNAGFTAKTNNKEKWGSTGFDDWTSSTSNTGDAGWDSTFAAAETEEHNWDALAHQVMDTVTSNEYYPPATPNTSTAVTVIEPPTAIVMAAVVKPKVPAWQAPRSTLEALGVKVSSPATEEQPSAESDVKESVEVNSIFGEDNATTGLTTTTLEEESRVPKEKNTRFPKSHTKFKPYDAKKFESSNETTKPPSSIHAHVPTNNRKTFTNPHSNPRFEREGHSNKQQLSWGDEANSSWNDIPADFTTVPVTVPEVPITSSETETTEGSSSSVSASSSSLTKFKSLRRENPLNIKRERGNDSAPRRDFNSTSVRKSAVLSWDDEQTGSSWNDAPPTVSAQDNESSTSSLNMNAETDIYGTLNTIYESEFKSDAFDSNKVVQAKADDWPTESSWASSSSSEFNQKKSSSDSNNGYGRKSYIDRFARGEGIEGRGRGRSAYRGSSTGFGSGRGGRFGAGRTNEYVESTAADGTVTADGNVVVEKSNVATIGEIVVVESVSDSIKEEAPSSAEDGEGGQNSASSGSGTGSSYVRGGGRGRGGGRFRGGGGRSGGGRSYEGRGSGRGEYKKQPREQGQGQELKGSEGISSSDEPIKEFKKESTNESEVSAFNTSSSPDKPVRSSRMRPIPGASGGRRFSGPPREAPSKNQS